MGNEPDKRTFRPFTPEDATEFQELEDIPVTRARYTVSSEVASILFDRKLLLLFSATTDLGYIDPNRHMGSLNPELRPGELDLYPYLEEASLISTEGLRDGIKLTFDNGGAITARDWDIIRIGEE